MAFNRTTRIKLTAMESDKEPLIRDVIRRIAVGPDRGRDISAEEAQAVMTDILLDRADPMQAAIFFIALRMKRESLGEFQGIFQALQNSMVQQTTTLSNLICLADPCDGYVRYVPATPFIPCVLAACDLPALITGLESVGPKHGVTAHKVYKLAGINPLLSTNQASTNLETKGWSYLDQSSYIPELFALGEFRDRMVKRTALTTLERLLLPLKSSGQTHLVLGYVHKAYPDIYSQIAFLAGYSSALLCKGVEGGFAPALNKPVRQFVFDFSAPDWRNTDKKIFQLPTSLSSQEAAQIAESDPDLAVHQCLEHGLQALSGKHNSLRNSIIVAAAQIICAVQSSDSFSRAVEKVQNCLDNGSANRCFQSMLTDGHMAQK